jgi:hypothetical protein
MNIEGFKKIVKFCEIAREKAGVQWAWVDTCCIDKRTDIVELADAIKNMFKWYARARTCIAYLDDITTSSNKKVKNSKWWTRGWTLQELIAPKALIFYNRAWDPIGSKLELASLIRNEFRIPEDVLTDQNAFKRYPHSVRLSWAAQRETTMIEDRAYSLLGLCQISMDMRYGERQEAFQRLQLEILRTVPGESILAWEVPVNRSQVTNSGVLARSPENFYHCSGVQMPGRRSDAGLSPQRPYANRVTSWGLEIHASAIPLVPKASTKNQTRAVQKDRYRMSPDQDGQPRYWAIPLTFEAERNCIAEYPSILIVVKRDPQNPIYERVETLKWRTGGPSPQKILAEHYDILGQMVNKKRMYLYLRDRP